MKMGMNKGLLATLALALAGMMTACGSPAPGDGPLPGVESLVFVQRAFERGDGTHDITGGSRQVIDYSRYTPGGGVYVLTPPTPDGELRSLTDMFEGVDIAGLDLSFDARSVTFAMRTADDRNYHIWTAPIDGSEEPRQLTFGDWDDVRPIFIPGDRIAFVTNEPYTVMGTRRDEYERDAVTQVATIATATGDADRRVCSHNLSHSADPFMLSDGQIGFARWEHLGGRNEVSLFRMNPDCSGVEAIAGEFNKGFNSIVQASEIEPGVFYGIGTSRSRTIQSGAVMRVDARSRAGLASLRIDVQDATFENLTPLVPTSEGSLPSGVGRYRYPRAVPGFEGIMVSWSDGDVSDRNELSDTAPQFGIYMLDAATGARTLVFDDVHMWDQWAIPVMVRDEPPVIRATVDANPDPRLPAVIGSIDVAETSLGETVSGAQFDGVSLHDALLEATRVRIIEGFSSEIGSVRMFGLTMHEGAAILGETPVYADGSWSAQVPGYLPYHLQPLDRFGLAIRNQMLWIQAMPGESRQCGGCHASRSGDVQPRMGMTTIAQSVGADTTTFRAIPDRVELPWYGATARGNLQDVFDRNCVSCHDGGASDPYAGRFYTVTVTDETTGEMRPYNIPYLLLTDEPIEVEYEMEVVAYPASYVTLLYPSAMMGDSVAMGDMAPEWVVPGSARRSRLIEVVNITAEEDDTAWAWADRSHDDTMRSGGITMSREDRMALIQMSDLGGQYYSRWNVEGATEWEALEY